MQKPKHKVCLVVLDGFGIQDKDKPYQPMPSVPMPQLEAMHHTSLYTALKAHGTAVGFSDDGMVGNSEVGHLTIGLGQVCPQGVSLLDKQLQRWDINPVVWQNLCQAPVLHLCGLLTTVYGHASREHILFLIKKAAETGSYCLRLHILLDGRDGPTQNAWQDWLWLSEHIQEFTQNFYTNTAKKLDIQLASGAGRMVATMDRYEQNWDMVYIGIQTHCYGIAEHKIHIDNLEPWLGNQYSTIDSDQWLPPFVIVDTDKQPVGVMNPQDACLFFNFRSDRSIQFSQVMDGYAPHKHKALPHYMPPPAGIYFAGMCVYEDDLGVPKNILVHRPSMPHTLYHYLEKHEIKHFSCAETHKIGHITYFFNGLHKQKSHTFVEIVSKPSHTIETDPSMACQEVTDVLLRALANQSDTYVFKVNFANPDMVGHTANRTACEQTLACLDAQMGRLIDFAKENHICLLVTADHGNIETLVDPITNKPHPGHTTSPVPCWIYNHPVYTKTHTQIYTNTNSMAEPGLSNIANTLLLLLGLPQDSQFNLSFLKPIIN
jgi:2,3-bisphosphoglycerate-independent phosphoglycerate mutase